MSAGTMGKSRGKREKGNDGSPGHRAASPREDLVTAAEKALGHTAGRGSPEKKPVVAQE